MARRGRIYARNTADATERARQRGGRGPYTLEDAYTQGRRSQRIVDVGQDVPEGYMRTGGRYFAKVKNMRTIRSKTTEAQRAMVEAHREAFYGLDGQSGWLRSAGNTGMYNAEESEANFRKSAGARKLIDGNGGTYGPDYGIAGTGTRAKSRYIIAFGQDGHMR